MLSSQHHQSAPGRHDVAGPPGQGHRARPDRTTRCTGQLFGHLFITGLLVDAETAAAARSKARSRAFAGPVGLAVAVQILVDRPARVAVRETARQIGAAASTVSAVVKALAAEGLVSRDGEPELTALFWRPQLPGTRRALTSHAPPIPSDPCGTRRWSSGWLVSSRWGWALSRDVCRCAAGAPIGLRSGAPPNLYVPSRTAPRHTRAWWRSGRWGGARPRRRERRPEPGRCSGRASRPPARSCARNRTACGRPWHWEASATTASSSMSSSSTRICPIGPLRRSGTCRGRGRSPSSPSCRGRSCRCSR